MIKESLLTSLYKKYEPLANVYVNKVHSFDKGGYERSDILQELRIKIYTAIQAYIKKFQEYVRTGRYKPVPIEYYLKSALANKVKDLIAKFNRLSEDGVNKLPLEETVEVGYLNTLYSELDYLKLTVVINGVNVLENLNTDDEKRCFVLYMKGWPISKLQKIFSLKFSASSVVEKQKAYLETRKRELYDFEVKQYNCNIYSDE